MIKSEVKNDAVAVHEFDLEHGMLARVSHPNIIKVLRSLSASVCVILKEFNSNIVGARFWKNSPSIHRVGVAGRRLVELPAGSAPGQARLHAAAVPSTVLHLLAAAVSCQGDRRVAGLPSLPLPSGSHHHPQRSIFLIFLRLVAEEINSY